MSSKENKFEFFVLPRSEIFLKHVHNYQFMDKNMFSLQLDLLQNIQKYKLSTNFSRPSRTEILSYFTSAGRSDQNTIILNFSQTFTKYQTIF